MNPQQAAELIEAVNAIKDLLGGLSVALVFIATYTTIKLVAWLFDLKPQWRK